jgi:hypothetical protein
MFEYWVVLHQKEGGKKLPPSETLNALDKLLELVTG